MLSLFISKRWLYDFAHMSNIKLTHEQDIIGAVLENDQSVEIVYRSHKIDLDGRLRLI